VTGEGDSRQEGYALTPSCVNISTDAKTASVTQSDAARNVLLANLLDLIKLLTCIGRPWTFAKWAIWAPFTPPPSPTHTPQPAGIGAKLVKLVVKLGNDHSQADCKNINSSGSA
jgi:hypothetical protein